MIKLPEIFREHMVLQQNKNIVVWGETNKKYVRVELDDKEVIGKSVNGRFEVSLPPLKAGGPYILKVIAGNNSENFKILDGESVVIGDVMVGEVWLACGQSNMELEINGSYKAENVLKNMNNNSIRFYYTPKCAYEGEELDSLKKDAHWSIANGDYNTAEEAGKWSAVAYYFAEKLSKELGVTVGIINCNWGGTHAYCWISREEITANNRIKRFMDEYDEIVKNQKPEDYDREYAEYVVYQAEFDRKCGEYYATHEHPSWEECIELCGENRYPGPVGPKAFTRPAGLYEVMLKQVMPYTLKGFIYYQGEEDDQTPELYYDLMFSMIRNWRKDWKDDNLPVLLVQLPMFKNESDKDFKNWPLVREAQARVAKTIKNTGVAVITDRGELNNIHPVHKLDVGFRLGNIALNVAYKKAEEKDVYGPTFRQIIVEKNKVTIEFDYADDGIIVRSENDNSDLCKEFNPKTKEEMDEMLESYKIYSGYICSGDNYVKSFEVAGMDKVYYEADEVSIDKNTIVVSSSKVDVPVYVRYNWTNFGKVMLYGNNGLPVAPFRSSMEDGSDNWDTSEKAVENRFGQAI